jgi:hypothetical protein
MVIHTRRVSVAERPSTVVKVYQRQEAQILYGNVHADRRYWYDTEQDMLINRITR